MAVEQHRSKEDTSLLADLEGNHEPNEKEEYQYPGGHLTPRTRQRPIALIASITLNIILALIICLPLLRPATQAEPPSKFASLSRTETEPYVLLNPYTSANATLSSALWHDIDIDAGVVALPDTFAASHGLPRAQRFPWDQSRGIYILHGYHNLHCVKIIHLALEEFRSGAPQTRAWHHVEHCVDALRRQVLCDADDTPRATERRAEVVSGVGQHRACRSWAALEGWARAHTACYKRPERPGDERGVERFSHCPEGSGFTVREGYVPTDELVEGLPAENVQTIEELLNAG